MEFRYGHSPVAIHHAIHGLRVTIYFPPRRCLKSSALPIASIADELLRHGPTPP